ncbi:MAG: C-GCAxxG-C-C family protein [Candidatus Ornithospirochaeta sp.]
MIDRGQKAYENFLSGYNCSQSVVLAYRDFFDGDIDSILTLVSPFGGGMGRLREVCGTVTGAFFVLGRIYGYSDPMDKDGKASLYSRIQDFASRFEKENSSIVCRDLLGLKGKSSPCPEERSAEYYRNRPCPEICRSSASILQKYLFEQGLLDEVGERI